MHVGLDGEFGQGEHHACEDVDDDLGWLVYCIQIVVEEGMCLFPLFLRDSYLLANAPRVPAEDRISAQQTGEEAVVPAFLPGACGIDVPEDEHGGFVDHGECGEVSGVLARGF